jgi:hypothetical protein
MEERVKPSKSELLDHGEYKMNNELIYQEVLILKHLFEERQTVGELFKKLPLDANVINNCLEELESRNLVISNNNDDSFELNYSALKNHYLGEYSESQPELSLLLNTKLINVFSGIN